ncbi:MAG: hypothetical protein AB7V18_08140 [Pyrinomonadaceae bacterium]
MQDIKNVAIAWVSTSATVFSAIELKTALAVLSALVLPVIFFAIGKSIDVALQLYFKHRDETHERDACTTDADEEADIWKRN